MKSGVAKAAVAMVAALSLVGCSSANMNGTTDTGVVTAHTHTDAWLMPIMIGKIITMWPQPANWSLDVKLSNGDVSQYSVSESSWDNVKDGAHLTIKDGAINSYTNPS